MAAYVPLSNEVHLGKGYRAEMNLSLISSRATLPLVHDEVASVALFAPLGFRKVERNGEELFSLEMLASLEPQKNLFCVAGKWLGDYVPSVMRTWPFSMEISPDGKGLYVAIDSEVILDEDAEDSVAFFGADGKLTAHMQKVIAMLESVVKSRAQTAEICRALGAADVLVPWPIKYKDVDETGATVIRSLNGLYHVDRHRLKQLDGDQLKALAESGALEVAYGQLLSEQRVAMLGKLKVAHRKAAEKQAAGSVMDEPDLDALFDGDDGLLKF